MMTTANNTNTTTTAVDTTTTITVADGRKWNLILDSEDAFAHANASLLESVINSIVANTSVRTNVNMEGLTNITEVLRKMSLKCGKLTISISDKFVESLDFSNFTKTYGVSEINRNLIKLLGFISKYGIWFEDTYVNSKGTGFC